MNNFGTLYRYELRKILCRRLTVLALAVMFLLTLGLNAAEYIVGRKLANDADSVLVGRVIDDALLDEMRAALSVTTATDENGETVIISAELTDDTYRHLWSYLEQIGGNESKAYHMTEEKLIRTFRGVIDEALKNERLTENEIAYWNERSEQTAIPPRYGREGGWGDSLVNLYMTNFLVLITIAATLSGVFADEYNLRTDALVFSASNGKKRLSFIKFLAGLTAGLLEAVFLLVEGTAIQFLVYGGVDAETSIQFYFGPSAMDMCAKPALLLCAGIFLLIALFYSTLTMLLSQVFRSATVPIAAMALLLFLSMLNVPHRFRVISQLWAYAPATFPGSWTFTDYRLVTIFGHSFNILEVMPVLYVLLIVLLAVILYRSYCRTQIGGR